MLCAGNERRHRHKNSLWTQWEKEREYRDLEGNSLEAHTAACDRWAVAKLVNATEDVKPGWAPRQPGGWGEGAFGG